MPAAQATSLGEYRLKNAEVYSERFGVNTLADLRALVATFATIDDHEVANDFAGGALIGSDDRFTAAFPGDDPAALINSSTLFGNGLRAFQEYNPIADEHYPVTGSDPLFDGRRKLYRARRFGDDAVMIMLDARSFRDPEVDFGNPAEIPAVFDPSRTMLGARQLADLRADLLDAHVRGVTWKLVVVPEPIQQLGAVGAADRFEGYFYERNELLRFIHANGIRNVVFICADIHGTVVNDLSFYDTGVPGGNQIPVGAFEISTGAVAFDAPFGQTVEAIAASPDFLLFADETVQVTGLLFGAIDAATLADVQALNDPLAENAAYYAALQSGPLAARNSYQQALLGQLLAADPVYGALDPVGLEAGQGIDFTVLAGDNPLTPVNEAFYQTFTYGWTELDIAADTQELTITTYGIDPYTEAAVVADPAAVSARAPTVLSRFSVRPRAASPGVGAYRTADRSFALDVNANGSWDAGIDRVTPAFGIAGDLPVAGDWNGDGVTEIGVYRPAVGRFYLDTNGNGLWDAGADRAITFGGVSDLPVAGDWDGDGVTEIGVFRPATGRFYLDINGNGLWEAGVDRVARFGGPNDQPVAGDWDGNGTVDIGVFRAVAGKFYLDANGDGLFGAGDITATFGGANDRPVAGDWDGDGSDEIGVLRPATGRLYRDTNGNGTWDAGGDAVTSFGGADALPVSGHWAP